MHCECRNNSLFCLEPQKWTLHSLKWCFNPVWSGDKQRLHCLCSFQQCCELHCLSRCCEAAHCPGLSVPAHCLLTLTSMLWHTRDTLQMGRGEVLWIYIKIQSHFVALPAKLVPSSPSVCPKAGLD